MSNIGSKTINLTTQELAIASYLEKYHGIDNPIAMQDLANIFDINERVVRRSIERIILDQKLVIGADSGVNRKNGYWVANIGQEKLANATPKSRIKKSLRRLAANKGNLKWVYNYLKELEQEYPNYHPDQLQVQVDELTTGAEN